MSLPDDTAGGAPTGWRVLEGVRAIIGDVAPEELALLAGLDDVDDSEIGRRFAAGRKGDDALGFGYAEFAVLATPIVWAAVQRVVGTVTDQAVDGITARVRARFGRGRTWHATPSATPPRLGPDELAELRTEVLELCVRAGMEQQRATQIADSTVAYLAVGGADE